MRTQRSARRSATGVVKKPVKLVEVDESTKIDTLIRGQRVGQELLGLSDGQLRQMYDRAIELLNASQGGEAIKAFTLLCHLHPYIPDFWYGLGVARRIEGQFTQALSSFLMAETMDCYSSEIVSAAVDCCLAMEDIAGAELCIKRLARHSHDKGLSQDEKRAMKREVHRLKSLVSCYAPPHRGE